MAKREGIRLNRFLASTLAGSVGKKEALRTRPGKRKKAPEK
jgi:hypothetical protein